MAVSRTLVAADNKVVFNYQKSPQYRSVHIDGAMASATTRGLLTVTLYNERPIIPRTSEREVLRVEGENVHLGDEIVTESLSGLMRQLEFTMYMDWQGAIELRDMLTRMLEAALEPEKGEEE